MKPSWDESPEWAQWLAMDDDGEFCWFENKPFLSDGMWFDAKDGREITHSFSVRGEPFIECRP